MLEDVKTCAEALCSRLSDLGSISIDACEIDGSQASANICDDKYSSQFSARRRAEFLAGRYCARSALKRVGCSDSPELKPLKIGAPANPGGFSISIAHKHNVAVAVALKREGNLLIGIDLEFVDKSDEILADQILREDELSFLRSQIPPRQSEMITAFFAVKEACFKSCSPLLQTREIDFADIRVTFNEDRVRFTAFTDYSGLTVSHTGAICTVGGVILALATCS